MSGAIDVRKVQRRTQTLLLLSQVLGSIAVTVTFAVSGILAVDMAGSTSAAGLTQATLTLGTAAASYLLATWMNRSGRRAGMATGYFIGALGAGLCVVAATAGSFALLIAGMAALGASSASTNIARYAATDLAPANRVATALSTVVWVATAGAVLGPLMVGPAVAAARDLGLPPLSGPLLLDMTAAVIAGLTIFVLLRPDPLIVARDLDRHQPRPDQPRPGSPAADRAGPRTVAPAIAALVLANATMVAVMVMTPLEMHTHGATHTAIGAVISAHFLGMYAFSPLSGLLADRAGVRAALAVGGATLIVALVVLTGALGQTAFTHGLGMFLVGLGWSVCTVAASSHVAACSVNDTRIQGAADTAMTVVSAAAAAAAGPLMGLWGFNGLLALAAVLTAGVLISASRLRAAPCSVHATVPAPGQGAEGAASRAGTR